MILPMALARAVAVGNGRLYRYAHTEGGEYAACVGPDGEIHISRNLFPVTDHPVMGWVPTPTPTREEMMRLRDLYRDMVARDPECESWRKCLEICEKQLAENYDADGNHL